MFYHRPPKITVLSLYIGQWHPLLPLFVKSAAANPVISWKLIGSPLPPTVATPLPSNVSHVPLTLRDFEAVVKSQLGLDVHIDNPQKLCDFRPALGMLFPELIEKSYFWGFCDTDIIVGDLSNFINQEILDRYPKLWIRGHFSLFRNCRQMNELFMAGGRHLDYREVMEDPKPRIFDEWKGMALILDSEDISVYKAECMGDIDSSTYQIRLVNRENFSPQTLIYHAPKLYQVFFDPKIQSIQKRELMYIHYQKRPFRPIAFDPYLHHLWSIQPNRVSALGALPTKLEEIRGANPTSWRGSIGILLRRIRKKIKRVLAAK